MAASPDERGEPLYPDPGYRLPRQATGAMSQLGNRMSASEPCLDEMAEAIGESGAHLAETWSKRVQMINSVDTRSQHWLPYHVVKFPDPMGAEVA